MGSYAAQAAPGASIFSTYDVVILTTQEARYALVKHKLTTTPHGGGAPTVRPIPDGETRKQVLREYFGITLPETETKAGRLSAKDSLPAFCRGCREQGTHVGLRPSPPGPWPQTRRPLKRTDRNAAILRLEPVFITGECRIAGGV